MRRLNGGIKTTVTTMGSRGKLWSAAAIWVTGLLLAGSEGAWMPYINCAGGLGFLFATVWLSRILPALDAEKKTTPSDTGYSKNNIRCYKRLASCTGGHGQTGMKPGFTRDLNVGGKLYSH